MVEFEVVFGVDAKVVHVDFQPFLPQHISKDVIHKCLEHGGSVAKFEEHDGRFKESHGCDECRFPLVFLSDVDVVVSPADVKFGEQGRLFHVVDKFRDERK